MTSLLAAEGVTFGYPGREVLRDVSFALSAGELVALCGPNGVGKSTLLRLLIGLHAPRAGRVALGGASLGSLRRREIARRVALLPQESPPDLPLTARETVALGRLPHLGRSEPERPADVAAVEAALAATDTAALAERPMTELSGGERHRVHLARALAQEAPVLLLDEPVAGLDLVHQLQALELLRATVGGAARAAVVALHDLSLAARYCDRILLLAGGALRADAPPAAVLTPETLAGVFGVRAEVRADEAGRPYVVPLAPLPRGP
ncbi:MAG TPA: ABC transporter ATP-binding protein [Polyangia bacterium]|nr:ABC transporter ATP-binding protein [Polyangia bacterium]